MQVCKINFSILSDTYIYEGKVKSSRPSLREPRDKRSLGLFSVGLPVKILKALLPSSILDTCPAHLNRQDIVILTTLGEWYKLRISSL